MDAITTALGAMTAATGRLDGYAGRLTRPGGLDQPGAAEAAVELVETRAQFKAGAKVVSIADDMMGTLLDMVV